MHSLLHQRSCSTNSAPHRRFRSAHGSYQHHHRPFSNGQPLRRRTTATYAHQPSQSAQFEALCRELLEVDTEELQQRVMRPGSAEASMAFLSWLSDQERCASGPQKEALARLAGDLLLVKEHADWEAAQRLLPSLASSLAYSNYADWRAQHGNAEVADVVPGQLTLEDLYKATEREEVKLRRQLSKSTGSTSRSSPSTLDSFADQRPAYAEMAAAAMARVRSRLCGYADGSEGAAAVLEELLHGCCCREERATVLPEAFTPPGLRLTGERAAAGGGGGAGSASSSVSSGVNSGSSSNSSSSSSRSSGAYGRPLPGSFGGSNSSSSSTERLSSVSSNHSSGAGDGRPVYVCSTPGEVLAAIQARQQELQQEPQQHLQQQPQQQQLQQQPQQEAGASAAHPASSPPPWPAEPSSREAHGASKPVMLQLLASGEALCSVLEELVEDIEDYDRHVYQRRSPLDRFGGARL